MNWESALDLVVAHTRHERYRALCDEGNPDHLVWRLRMVERAAGLGTAPAPSRFRREDPDYSVPPRPRDIKKELVVCRYQEDLNWLSRVPTDFYVNVYGKSDWEYTLERTHRYQRLRNVGREAQAMLYHISTFYDSLAEWTYFSQGDALEHSPDFLGRLAVPYKHLCSMTAMYSSTHPARWVREHDRVEEVGGYKVAYGDADIPQHNGQPCEAWFNPAAWSYVFACDQPKPLFFGYAAHWAVPRSAILARPRGFWKWMLAEVERTTVTEDHWSDPPLTAWAVEVLWMYLFGDPKTYPVKWSGAEVKGRGCACNDATKARVIEKSRKRLSKPNRS